MTQEKNDMSIKESSNTEQQKLDAVRDLLFGQNVQEYRTEIEELKKAIEDNKLKAEKDAEEYNQTLLNKIANTESLILEKIGSLNNEISSKIDELDDKKADRKILAKALHEIANQLEN